MNPDAAPIEALQSEMGKALDRAIRRQGGKVAFAEKAGLNRTTLYRLLRGENVSTDVLLRTLRALGRQDLLNQLITPPEPSPLERRPRTKSTRKRTQPSALVAQLALGRSDAESQSNPKSQSNPDQQSDPEQRKSEELNDG